MTNILTNSAALKSLYHLQRNEGTATQATERLASGKRLNKAGDDAAGAAIVNRMTSQINGMEVAIRNAGDAISMAQTAEGALNEVSEILQRMRELGVQAANGTYSGADRVALNEEIGALKKELIRISEATQFNTSKLLNGTFQDTEFEIGYDESPQHTHTLSIENIKPSALGIWSSSTQLEKTATGNGTVTTAGVITTDATHGFEKGDIITYELPSGATPIAGLVSGRQYKVCNPVTANTFGLTNLENTPDNNATDSNIIAFGEATKFTGLGAKFHLANIAGSPSTTASNTTTALSSLTTKDETLKVYGYVGDATISYATGATSKEISEAISAQSGITGVSAYAETNVRLTIRETFKKYINKLTVVDTGVTEVQNYIKVSNQKTFSIPKTKEYLPAKKTVFNKIVGDSHFELLFAGFLDAAIDVKKFIKNYMQLNFKMTYINHEGGISNYYPDFVIHLNNGERFIALFSKYEVNPSELFNYAVESENYQSGMNEPVDSYLKIYESGWQLNQEPKLIGQIPLEKNLNNVFAISSDGKTIVVGTTSDPFTENNIDQNGYVKVYKQDISSNAWIQYGETINDASYYQFGQSVSISDLGDIAITSAGKLNESGQLIVDENGDIESIVSIYNFNDNLWQRKEKEFNFDPIPLNLASSLKTHISANGGSLTLASSKNAKVFTLSDFNHSNSIANFALNSSVNENDIEKISYEINEITPDLEGIKEIKYKT